MRTSNQRLSVLATLVCAAITSAAPITRNAIGPVDTLLVKQSRLDHAEVLRPNTLAALGLWWDWMPSPRIQPMRDELGLVYGYPYSQGVQMLLANPMEGTHSLFGFSLTMARWGWDRSDFILYPDEGAFAQSRQLIDAGAIWEVPGFGFATSAGVSWLRASHDPEGAAGNFPGLRWWHTLRWNWIEAQSLWQRGDLEWVEGRLDLQARQVDGRDSSGWTTYLPDLGVSVWPKDVATLEFSVRQNVFRQHIYLDWSGRPEDDWKGALRLEAHPDPAHLVTGELAVGTSASGRGGIGGAIEVPFIRLSYNHPDDKARFFGADGLWLFELHFDLVTMTGNRYLHSGAARPSPLETDAVKKEGK